MGINESLLSYEEMAHEIDALNLEMRSLQSSLDGCCSKVKLLVEQKMQLTAEDTRKCDLLKTILWLVTDDSEGPKYSTYERLASRIRHEITRDSGRQELCEHDWDLIGEDEQYALHGPDEVGDPFTVYGWKCQKPECGVIENTITGQPPTTPDSIQGNGDDS